MSRDIAQRHMVMAHEVRRSQSRRRDSHKKRSAVDRLAILTFSPKPLTCKGWVDKINSIAVSHEAIRDEQIGLRVGFTAAESAVSSNWLADSLWIADSLGFGDNAFLLD